MSKLPQRWLLLRGLGRQVGHWFDFPGELSTALGISCEVQELPGVGSRQDESVPPSVTSIATDVEALLRDRYADETFGVLGVSLGSMIALSLAHQVPVRVSHLVLVNSSSRLSSVRLRLRPRAMLALVAAALEQDAVRRERRVYRLTSNANDAAVDSWARRSAALTLAHPLRPSAVLYQLIAAARFNPPHVTTPTLVLSSRHDRLVSPQCSEALAAYLGARHSSHPTAGHDLPLDDPQWVVGQMLDWLDWLESKSQRSIASCNSVAR